MTQVCSALTVVPQLIKIVRSGPRKMVVQSLIDSTPLPKDDSTVWGAFVSFCCPSIFKATAMIRVMMKIPNARTVIDLALG